MVFQRDGALIERERRDERERERERRGEDPWEPFQPQSDVWILFGVSWEATGGK